MRRHGLVALSPAALGSDFFCFVWSYSGDGDYTSSNFSFMTPHCHAGNGSAVLLTSQQADPTSLA